MGQKTFNINEIFHSIQGEGVFVGTPSTFIRTNSCDLRCDWCDTPYTSWNSEKNIMSLDEILLKVDQITPKTTDHIVITGGEPTLQINLPELITLLRQDFYVTLETSGTRKRDVYPNIFSVSPKLSSSTPSKERSKYWNYQHERKRINLEVLKYYSKLDNSYFKFVINNEQDLNEVNDLISKIDIYHPKVYLMPEGRTSEEVKSKYQWLAEVCKKEGYILTPRLHVEIWGDRRGV